jgi:hypothetical protein
VIVDVDNECDGASSNARYAIAIEALVARMHRGRRRIAQTQTQYGRSRLDWGGAVRESMPSGLQALLA